MASLACHLLSAPGLGPACWLSGCRYLGMVTVSQKQAAGARILEEIMPQLSLERLVSVHVACKSEEEQACSEHPRHRALPGRELQG